MAALDHSPFVAGLSATFFAVATMIFLVLLLRGRRDTPRQTRAGRLAARAELGLEAVAAAVMTLMFATMAT